MSIYCPLAEALGIQTTISILDIPYEPCESRKEDILSLTSKNIQRMRVEEGTHNFQDKEWASKRSQKFLAEGIHPFQRDNFQKEIQDNLVKTGKHHLLGGEYQKKQLESGKHPSQVVRTCPHCGKTGRGGGMKQFHFDKCKEKKV
jgi:hypothetical protein